MKEKIARLMNNKMFHIVIIVIIIAIILLFFVFVILKYNVEGETNMPFKLSKMAVISSVEGIDKEPNGNKWGFDVNQNNDIYLYFDKNSNYGKQEAISSIVLENINIEKTGNKGINKIYRPDANEENKIFKNCQENEMQTIEYVGDIETNIKQMKIANQGGIIAFRYSNDKVSEYFSNDDEINHSDLLNKTNVTEEELKANLNFDIVIKTNLGKEYKSTIFLEMPVEGVVERGTTSKEFTDVSQFIFKRIKN